MLDIRVRKAIRFRKTALFDVVRRSESGGGCGTGVKNYDA